MMDYIIISVVLFFMFFFTYVGFHMAIEKDKKKYIPLPWEPGGFLNKKNEKPFNKSDIQYRDGDNT